MQKNGTRNVVLVCALTFAMTFAPRAEADFVVVDVGRPKAVISVADGATGAARYAAKDLVKYVKAMTGAELKIVTPDLVDAGENAIVIGEVKPGMRRDEISISLDRTGRRISLAGEGACGCLYATYELLEHWGVRFFSARQEKIPSVKSLSLPKDYKVSYAPPFEQRNPGSYPLDRTDGPAWATKLRVSRNYKKIGGDWDGNVGSPHSLGNQSFVNVKTFFAEHPEWYALRGGKRVTDGQLCHSNPEMRAELLREVKAKSAGKAAVGGIHYLNLSFLDNNKFCQCDGCNALRKRWGGSVVGHALDIADFIAREIEHDLPGLRVSTLAYWAWCDPPKKISSALHTNVYVTVCQNGNKALPLAAQKDLMARLDGWNAVAPGRIRIWDWDACFRNYITPYPTYHLFGEDFRTYRSLGVKAVSSQLPHGGPLADFVDLRTYLYAKLAWNPDLDGEALAKEWIDFCCSKGAPDVWDYYRLVERAVWGANPGDRKTKCRLHGYNSGRDWLSAKALAESFRSFERALAATGDEPEAHKTVRCLCAGMLELVIERYDEVQREMKQLNPARGEKVSNLPSRLELVDRFERLTLDFKSWCWREGPQPRDFASLVKGLKEGVR